MSQSFSDPLARVPTAFSSVEDVTVVWEWSVTFLSVHPARSMFHAAPEQVREEALLAPE